MAFWINFNARIQLLMTLWAILLLFTGCIAGWPSGSGGVIARYHYHARPFVFPAGSRTLFPGYRMIALYGTPDVPQLGAIGEQPAAASIARIQSLAATYQPLMTERVYPTLEIIATVASGSPQPDESYSYAVRQSTLLQWIVAAYFSGTYVVLDLQPGRDDFESQAKQLQTLLAFPNVGLALDPEWRLAPSQLPLKQIGSVSISEVNRVDGWLADFTKNNALPQKLFVLHQFRLDMLPDRQKLDTSHAQLAYVIQMDGQGTQPEKLASWSNITARPPDNVRFGWKDFYTKDNPIRSPDDTMHLTPKPWYISYQ